MLWIDTGGAGELQRAGGGVAEAAGLWGRTAEKQVGEERENVRQPELDCIRGKGNLLDSKTNT